MVMGSYCQQVITFFFFGLQLTVRLKLQFQSGTPLFKSLDPPLLTGHCLSELSVLHKIYLKYTFPLISPMQSSIKWVIFEEGIF